MTSITLKYRHHPGKKVHSGLLHLTNCLYLRIKDVGATEQISERLSETLIVGYLVLCPGEN